MQRFIAGDPLRAIAALSVLLYHVGYVVAEAGLGAVGTSTVYGEDFADAFGFLPGRALHAGATGLWLFFVLSGYLLARPFARALIEGKPLPPLGPYVRNRAVRIVPAFWAGVVVTLLVVGLNGTSATELLAVFGFAQVLHPSTLSGNIPQAWTLGVEASFYLALPLLAAAIAAAARHRRVRATRLLAGLLVADLLLVALRQLGPDDDAFLQTLPAMLFAFVPGIALAVLEVAGPPRPSGRATLALLGLAVAALGAYVLVGSGPVAARALLVSLGAGALVAAPLAHQWRTGGCPRLLDHPVLHWLGERSYSLYVLHYAVLLLLIERAGDAPDPRTTVLWLGPLAVVLSIAAADLSYRFVERPFLRRRARWQGAQAASRSATDQTVTPSPAA